MSAWDRAVNIHSSGHAHGSIDTHEDSVALLLDVLCPTVTCRQSHSHKNTHTHTHTRTNRHKEKETEALSACVDADSLLFKTKRQMWGESYDSCSVSSMCHLFLCAISFTFQQGYCMSPEADKSSLMVQLLGVNGQINLAHLKEKLPIK